ncbi:MAG: SRPBCC family protein [Bacteroidales bacterium]|nr:MAG: SRPBCC family protein [Bacteroidales bacterium]
MTEFESKVVTISRSSEEVFRVLSDFRLFTPFIPADKLEDWKAEEDSCSFSVKGVGQTGLKIVEKEPFKTVKITGDGKLPFEFFLWVQLKEVEPNDTRMKLTLKAELNMMLKMMLGKKIEEGINTMAEGIAAAFNKTVIS